MRSSGVVKEKTEKEIIVSMFRDSACSHCDKCGDDKKISNDFSISTDRDDISVGDIITFEMADEQVFKAAMIVYLIPVVAMFLGYFIGDKLNYSDGIKIFMTFGFMLLSFLGLHIYDKKVVKAKTDASIEIVSVEKKEEEKK